jgi:hypothetical protein
LTAVATFDGSARPSTTRAGVHSPTGAATASATLATGSVDVS